MFNYKNYNQKSFRIKRKLLEMTCKELGDICRCTKQTIVNAETNKTNNRLTITFIGYTLDKLAEEKDLTNLFKQIDELLKENDDCEKIFTAFNRLRCL